MSDQERDLAGKITSYLDRGAAELRPGLAYRLQRVRAEALARLSEPERASALAPAFLAGRTATIGGGPRPFYHQLRFWLAIVVLATAVFGTQQWRAYQQVKELEDLDSQILTSDLPIDAYLDRGFQNWLKASDSD